jgi:hypothetical protein
MPQQTTIAAADTPTLLTDANVTSITFQNQGAHDLLVMGTATTTPPSAALAGWLRYPPGTGERNAAVADLFPGVPSVARIWGMTLNGRVGVLVSHA